MNERVFYVYVVIVSSEKDLQAAFSIRKTVFVQEQNVPIEEELDQYDNTATHFLLYYTEEPIGTGRCRKINNTLKAERICVLEPYRKLGAGLQIMETIEDYAHSENIDCIKLDAQTHAKGFYLKLGYHIVSEEFLDAGIPHVTMKKHL